MVPENHGIDGHRFAPLDFFASYGVELPIDTASEDVKEESRVLHEMAKADVEGAIAETIEGMKNPKDDKMDSEELDDIAIFVEMVARGESLEEFEKKVIEMGDKLNDKQLGFLRNLARTMK